MSQQLHRSNRETFSIHQTSELIKTLTQPNFQRLANEERVETIKSSILSLLDNGIEPILPSCLVICYNPIQEIRYIVDGLHRFCAYVKILEEAKKDLCIVCNTIEVESEKEAEDIFQLVNKTEPLPKMPTGVSLNVPNQIVKMFKTKYAGILKATNNPHRPHISENLFIETIGTILNDRPDLTGDEIIKRIVAKNIAFSKLEANKFKIKAGDKPDNIQKYLDKAREKKCYLGMFQDLKWLKDEFGILGTKGKKDKIPDALRKMVWDNSDKRCPCCSKELTEDSFHCSHIISEANGGETEFDNLIPMCMGCNLKVGKRNLEEYLEKIN